MAVRMCFGRSSFLVWLLRPGVRGVAMGAVVFSEARSDESGS
jgi:hypothetical protein